MGLTAAHSDSLKGCRRRIFARRDFPSGCGRKISATGKLPRRRIPAIRNFPPGCGRNACIVTAEMNPYVETVSNDAKQVREKVLGEDLFSIGLKENIVKDVAVKVEVESEGIIGKEEQVQVRTASDGNLEVENPLQARCQPQSKSQSAIKNIEGKVGNLKGEMGKESAECFKKSLKRTFPRGSGNENDPISKCCRKQSIGSASSDNKVPWQPSMAALNFARIHGKHCPTSNLVPSSSGNNVKKHELMVKTALGPSNNRVIVQALMAAPNCPRRQRIKGNLTYSQKQCRKA